MKINIIGGGPAATPKNFLFQDAAFHGGWQGHLWSPPPLLPIRRCWYAAL